MCLYAAIETSNASEPAVTVTNQGALLAAIQIIHSLPHSIHLVLLTPSCAVAPLAALVGKLHLVALAWWKAKVQAWSSEWAGVAYTAAQQRTLRSQACVQLISSWRQSIAHSQRHAFNCVI